MIRYFVHVVLKIVAFLFFTSFSTGFMLCRWTSALGRIVLFSCFCHMYSTRSGSGFSSRSRGRLSSDSFVRLIMVGAEVIVFPDNSFPFLSRDHDVLSGVVGTKISRIVRKLASRSRPHCPASSLRFPRVLTR